MWLSRMTCLWLFFTQSPLCDFTSSLSLSPSRQLLELTKGSGQYPQNALVQLPWHSDPQLQLAASLLSSTKPTSHPPTGCFSANSRWLLLHRSAATCRNGGIFTALQHCFTLSSTNNAEVQPHQKDHILNPKSLLSSLMPTLEKD